MSTYTDPFWHTFNKDYPNSNEEREESWNKNRTLKKLEEGQIRAQEKIVIKGENYAH